MENYRTETVRPLILITNDDSYTAPGLQILARTVAPLGDVIVVAPEAPHSGQSSAITVNNALRLTQMPDIITDNRETIKIFTVNGTPVDCVKLGLHHACPRRPDIFLAGINHGSNAGDSLIYSGTMGAVMEACKQGLPSVGHSLMHHSMKADFSQAIPFCLSTTRAILEGSVILPHGVCLNINYPAEVEIKGLKVVRAAMSRWTEEYRRYDDPHGHPFFLLSGELINEEPESEETDLYWLSRQFATAVPVTVDQNSSRDIRSAIAEELG